MKYLPETNDICVLTQQTTEDEIKNGVKIIPCIVTIEYQNEYCWLIRYADSDQCMMIKKNERHFFKDI